MITGAVLCASGFAWFAGISPDGSFLIHVLGPSLVTSVGFGLCLAPLVSTATAGVADQETGTASGLLNSSRQLGATLGLAVIGTTAQRGAGPSPELADLSHGYALGFGLCAALLIGAALVAGLVLPCRARAAVAPAGPSARTS